MQACADEEDYGVQLTIARMLRAVQRAVGVCGVTIRENGILADSPGTCGHAAYKRKARNGEDERDFGGHHTFRFSSSLRLVTNLIIRAFPLVLHRLDG